MSSEKLSWRVLFIVYNGLLLTGSFFLLPLIVYSLATTAKRRKTFRQRMGWCRYPWQEVGGRGPGKCIWVHALSVGEVQAAQPMVIRLRKLHPEARICLSASTYTGFQTAEGLFGRQDRIELAYFPYDLIWAVRNVVSKIKPSLVIQTETDIWPNFLMEMRRCNVPVFLINLRLSEGSWTTYRRLKGLAGIIFRGFEKIAVQDQKDLKRLIQLGVPSEKVIVAGNIKFDSVTALSASDSAVRWKRDLGIHPQKRVVVAGSTHEGEERFLIEILASFKRQEDAPVLILAPRDPNRSSEIQKLLTVKGLHGHLLSALIKESPGTGCPEAVVVDSIGVLKALYSLADIVFIGGSLVPCGGHNPLEPAAWGKPILFGPDMRDFRLISELLLEARGAHQVTNAKELADSIKRLLADSRSARKMGQRAQQVFGFHHGAVDKALEFFGLAPTQEE